MDRDFVLDVGNCPFMFDETKKTLCVTSNSSHWYVLTEKGYKFNGDFEFIRIVTLATPDNIRLAKEPEVFQL